MNVVLALSIWKHRLAKLWAFCLSMNTSVSTQFVETYPGLILGLRQANERRRYKVTPSPIVWAQT